MKETRIDKTGAQLAAGGTAFGVIVAISFCHLLNDLMQSLLPAIYPGLKSELHLSFGQIGMVTLVYQITASILQPMIGLYADKRPTPMALPGIASTLLLNIILAWNEAFWTLQLTTSDAAPLTQFIASYSSPEGLFYAKLSAASTMAIAPILILGWFSQKQLVRGLTFGAVK